MLKIGMNGKEVDALIDTGASRSVISRSFANFIWAKIKRLKSSDLTILTTADGHLVKVLGTTKVDVNLSSEIMKFEF